MKRKNTHVPARAPELRSAATHGQVSALCGGGQLQARIDRAHPGLPGPTDGRTDRRAAGVSCSTAT